MAYTVIRYNPNMHTNENYVHIIKFNLMEYNDLIYNITLTSTKKDHFNVVDQVIGSIKFFD